MRRVLSTSFVFCAALALSVWSYAEDKQTSLSLESYRLENGITGNLVDGTGPSVTGAGQVSFSTPETVGTFLQAPAMTKLRLTLKAEVEGAPASKPSPDSDAKLRTDGSFGAVLPASNFEFRLEKPYSFEFESNPYTILPFVNVTGGSDLRIGREGTVMFAGGLGYNNTSKGEGGYQVIAGTAELQGGAYQPFTGTVQNPEDANLSDPWKGFVDAKATGELKLCGRVVRPRTYGCLELGGGGFAGAVIAGVQGNAGLSLEHYITDDQFKLNTPALYLHAGVDGLVMHDGQEPQSNGHAGFTVGVAAQ